MNQQSPEHQLINLNLYSAYNATFGTCIVQRVSPNMHIIMH